MIPCASSFPRPCLFVLLAAWGLARGLPAAEPSADAEEAVAAGHSYHGEAFNEGPRQEARLMDGLPTLTFPTSAESPQAQAFVTQGVAQLHGFWYLEAERSFRQAAAEEPTLAIAYWGMAMANVNNRERARGLIDKAMELREGATTDREKQYIEALDRYLGEAPDAAQEDAAQEDDMPEDADKQVDKEAKKEAEKEAKQQRAERFIADLEQILHDYPDDVEAKAFLAVHLWMFEREGVKMPSRYAVDALLGDVFDVQPMHPAHHYRIHLWDRQRPENALASAAKCGPAMPAVAHMWHMPGHIYSRLHRYGDAAWQQEASARVDHAHMSRARLMPDQIHNFAHNNEWLTRNLIHVGRVHDALVQARNLVSLPRHPQYNSMEKRGSFRYGHQRLLQVLTTYGLWETLIEEAAGPFLPETGDLEADEERLAWLAVAHLRTGQRAQGESLYRRLQRRQLDDQDQLATLTAATEEAATEDAATEDAANATQADDAASADGEASDEDALAEVDPQTLEKRIKQRKPLLARIAAAVAVREKDAESFALHAKTAKLDKLLRARWEAEAGNLEAAVATARQLVKDSPGEVPPLAVLVDLLWRHDQQEAAQAEFTRLRSVAADADLETPLLQRLTPVAEAAEAGADWVIRQAPADDLGERPALAKLGPFRWQSYQAPSWQALNAEAEPVADTAFAGRPRIVIFYLGFGCLHCVEQLHAFAPHAEAFGDAGIDLVAISSERVEQLQLGLKNFDEALPIPLLADPEQQVFKQYACWDDFEQQPLHGTFLIDRQDRVRWQDISHEPFTDAEFLVEEAQRLLALPIE